MPSLRTHVLENEFLRVVVAPRAGGRIVSVSRPDGPNLLKVDPHLLGNYRWSGKATPRSRFEQWNGHTVWVGPQSAFWSNQRVLPDRRGKKAVWPPDPFVEKAGYDVTHASNTSITMVSPDSPVCGLRVTKHIRLDSEGKVHFRATGENIRAKPVSADLWLNTRVDGFSRCYVPLGPDSEIRIQHPPRKGRRRADLMEFHDVDGYFTFNPQPPSSARANRWAKAFLYPSRGLIAAFTATDLLAIHFAHHAQNSIHPEQALVELYNATGTGGAGSLLELEYHAPYRTLEPGASMHAQQTWTVRAYDGESTAEAHTAFLKKSRI